MKGAGPQGAVEALAHSKGWHLFALELDTAGVVVGAPMLSIPPVDLSKLRYLVPAAPVLMRDADGSSWLEWPSARVVRTLSPPGGTYLADLLRLDAASDE